MEVTVRGKHFEVPTLIEQRARRKLGRLDHYLPALQGAIVEADVWHEATKEPERRFVIHVTVSGNGVHLRAEGRAARLEVAVDQASQVLTRQARRHKERLYGRNRNSGLKAAPVPEAAAPPEDEAGEPALSKVGEVRHVAVKPMTVEEAVEQMEALGEEYLLFLEDAGRRFALLRRRRNGDYALIIPELS